MNIPIHSSLLLGIAATYALSMEATADAPLSAAQLREYCMAWRAEPGSSAAAACIAYVQGFLDGATSIDGRIQTEAAAKSESFLDRARRTRLAPTNMARPPYCLDASVPLSRIIHQLLAHYETRQLDEELPASAVVASTLRRFHPC